MVRSRGSFNIGVQGTTGDVDIIGALGICIVSDLAFAAGAASIPGPWTNNDWDGWFLLQPFNLHFQFTTDVGWNVIQSEYMVDSKGMRKAVDGDTLVVMIETQSGACRCSDKIRSLFMLP